MNTLDNIIEILKIERHIKLTRPIYFHHLNVDVNSITIKEIEISISGMNQTCLLNDVNPEVLELIYNEIKANKFI